MVHWMKRSVANRGASEGASEGFIVVAVLWMLGALSALVSIYAIYVINTATGFVGHDDRLRAEYLVSAGVELTAFRQLLAQDQPGSTPQYFDFVLGGANVAVNYKSEAARIDLNVAPKPMLVGLFVALGARNDSAELYADRIISWRTTPSNGQDAEASAYRASRLGYEQRGASFPHTSELSLVRDLPIALVERVLPFVTVYSGRPKINVLEAEPEVIAALPGITQDNLAAVLAQRQAIPEKREALLPLLGAAQQYATIESGKAVRINIQVTFDGGGQFNSEVVILMMENGDKPFAILTWRDELNRPSANGNSRKSFQ
jgi:general secretion pathway protein K